SYRRATDLIDLIAVFTRLDTKALRPRRREIDVRTHDVRAPPVVLPAPPGVSAARAIFEDDGRRVRRADAIDGRPGRRYRARELRVRRVVAPVIVLRAAAEPQVIWHAGDGVERQVHVIRRRCRRRRDIRGNGVRMTDEVSPRGASVVQVDTS